MQNSSYGFNSRCIFDGINAEVEFANIAEKRGYSCRKAGRKGEYSHIDLFIDKEGKTHSFDIKSRKRVSRKDNDFSKSCVWIEFKNNNGDEGWLYGGADYIAFQNCKGFLVIPRKKLVEWCKKNIDLKNIVNKSSDAYKRGYSRKGREDLISRVSFSDIKHLGKLWV